MEIKTFEVFTEEYSKIYQADTIFDAILLHYGKSPLDNIVAITLADRPDLLKKIDPSSNIIKAIMDFTIINPALVSDGHGEFPDGYKMSEKDAESLLSIIEAMKGGKDERTRDAKD
jgi:hypothetical protein